MAGRRGEIRFQSICVPRSLIRKYFCLANRRARGALHSSVAASSRPSARPSAGRLGAQPSGSPRAMIIIHRSSSSSSSSFVRLRGRATISLGRSASSQWPLGTVAVGRLQPSPSRPQTSAAGPLGSAASWRRGCGERRRRRSDNGAESSMSSDWLARWLAGWRPSGDTLGGEQCDGPGRPDATVSLKRRAARLKRSSSGRAGR